MPGGYCRNSGTWGSPDAVKVGPSHMGPLRRHSRPRHKTGRWPPHLPHGVPTRAASTSKARNLGTLRAPLDPEDGVEVPGTPTPGRRPGSPRPAKGGRPHLTSLRRILGRKEATSPPKKNAEGFSRLKPPPPQRCPCGTPLAYKRRTKAPEGKDGISESRMLG